MLQQSGFEPAYMLKAANSAIYTLQRCETSGMPTGKTPYELWWGRKPTVGHFRCFGSDCYARLSNSRRKAIGSKAIHCKMLGYQGGGYRLLNITTGKVILRRHVVFDERSVMETLRKICNPPQEEQQPSTHNFESQFEIFPEPVNTDNQAHIEVEPLRRSTRVNLGQPPERLTYANSVKFDEVSTQEEYIMAVCYHIQTPMIGLTEYENIATQLSFLTSDHDVPQTRNAAVKSPESAEWEKAMQYEVDKLQENNTWDLVPRPSHKPVIQARWVFAKKKDQHGNVTSFRARHVAKGFTQTKGVDYNHTYAPVVKFSTVRVILAVAAALDMDLHQMDAPSAFLNGEVEEEIYVEQPEGFIKPGDENLVCRLNKGLYGTKQAGNIWNKKFATVIVQQSRYRRLTADRSVFMKRTPGGITYVFVHVDHGIISSTDPEEGDCLKKILSDAFNIKYLGSPKCFLNMEILQNRERREIYLNQKAYLQKILNRFNMENSTPVNCPMQNTTCLRRGRTSNKFSLSSSSGIYHVCNGRNTAGLDFCDPRLVAIHE